MAYGILSFQGTSYALGSLSGLGTAGESFDVELRLWSQNQPARQAMPANESYPIDWKRPYGLGKSWMGNTN
eukprot:CAMPEP_0171317780 /NCGR_PEP_ID=MMETSP0816-20121228/83191_1 /TAXON_ID=420281 /ORGANISM="Proboscia inermis, Strain CCAP1064/1" /LENGTH=70 /DNA_ID=CAMNT_0011811435 /DNA_START=292 /DNA_END=501 /DNA_ORIENTATION=+